MIEIMGFAEHKRVKEQEKVKSFLKNVNRLTPNHAPTYHGNYAVICTKDASMDSKGCRRFKIFRVDENHKKLECIKSNLTIGQLRKAFE